MWQAPRGSICLREPSGERNHSKEDRVYGLGGKDEVQCSVLGQFRRFMSSTGPTESVLCAGEKEATSHTSNRTWTNISIGHLKNRHCEFESRVPELTTITVKGFSPSTGQSTGQARLVKV